jgi:hypothetical protein
MMRAARTGGVRHGPGELIQEPSGGGVLSTFGVPADAGVGDLRLTLEGLVQESPVARVAGKRPAAFSPPAELFTSSGDALFLERFPRW